MPLGYLNVWWFTSVHYLVTTPVKSTRLHTHTPSLSLIHYMYIIYVCTYMWCIVLYCIAWHAPHDLLWLIGFGQARLNHKSPSTTVVINRCPSGWYTQTQPFLMPRHWLLIACPSSTAGYKPPVLIADMHCSSSTNNEGWSSRAITVNRMEC